MSRTNAGLLILLCSSVALSLYSAPLLDVHHQETAENDTSLYTFTFNLSTSGNRLIMNVESEMVQGTLTVFITGGGYEVIGNFRNQGAFTYDNVIFGPLNAKEPIEVTVTAIDAVGPWHATFTEFSNASACTGLVVSGIIVVILSIGVVAWWKRRYHESMKWAWLGGGIWAIGVVLKFVVAMLVNEPILAWLKPLLPQALYLAAGSLYIGSLTGIFEIGITLLFAVLIKKMTTSPYRAIGIGVGAGVVEALLIGFSQLGNAAYLLYGGQGSSEIMGSLVATISLNPYFFLLAPVERAITICCHISSRVLVILAVSRRKYGYFWAGFLLMTGIDTIAGYAHLSGLLTTTTMWWIELAILPFAIASLLIVWWCVRKWPQGEPSASAAQN
jgi:uncharacterized membrane protein YhfC